MSTNTWASTWVISIGGIGYCLKQTTKTLQDKTVPLMGVMSAFIFAAQMLNFPTIGGTSGHLLGGVLAAVLLGPHAAAVILAIVLIIQCFVFQDGGITALGANIFNMAFVGTIGGYIIYKIIKNIFGKRLTSLKRIATKAQRHKECNVGVQNFEPLQENFLAKTDQNTFCKGLNISNNRGIIFAVAISAWFSVIISSAAAAIELGISGTSPIKIVFPAMVGAHAIIGIGEAIITNLVIGFILKVRPDLIYH